jgi:hypothetical protein
MLVSDMPDWRLCDFNVNGWPAVFTQCLACCWINEVNSPTDGADHRFVGICVIFHYFGRIALDLKFGVRAAIDDKYDHVSFVARCGGASFVKQPLFWGLSPGGSTKTTRRFSALRIALVGRRWPLRTLLSVVRSMPVFLAHAVGPPARFTSERSKRITSSSSKVRI